MNAEQQLTKDLLKSIRTDQQSAQAVDQQSAIERMRSMSADQK